MAWRRPHGIAARLTVLVRPVDRNGRALDPYGAWPSDDSAEQHVRWRLLVEPWWVGFGLFVGRFVLRFGFGVVDLFGFHRLDFAGFGGLLDESWQLKRKLAAGVTSADIDRWYAMAQELGAYGGKIAGAGGGGFLLLCVPVASDSTTT